MVVTWKRGEFISFVATMKIKVGGNNGGQPFDILQDDEFEYDGSVCRYAGAEHQTPQLRGAIRNGWAVTKDGGEEVREAAPTPHRPVRAMARAQTQNRDLSRVQRGEPVSVGWDDADEDVVLQVSDRRGVMDPRTGRGHLTNEHNRRTASDPSRKPVMSGGRTELGYATASDFAKQDHTEISRIKTPATLKVDILKNPGAAQLIEGRLSAEHGAGRFHGDSPSREGISVRTNVRQMDRGGSVEVWDGDEGEYAGEVRHTDTRTNREGISVRDTSNPRTSGHRPLPQRPAGRPAPTTAKKASAAKAPAKPEPRKQSVAKKPATPVPVKAAAKPAEPMNPKLRIATSVCPEFPRDWNFFGTTEAKLDRVKELGADPRLIDAVYAADSAPVRSALQKAYPSHFAG